MWRFVLALALFAHGLAHLSGFLAAWTSRDLGYTTQPWLLSPGVHLQSGPGRAFGLFWLIAMIGLTGSALGVVFRQAWWPALAMASSVVSLLVIVPWWQTVPPAFLSVGAALITIILKSAAYLLTGSVGLLSDALESLVNLVAALVAVWALTLATRPSVADGFPSTPTP